MIALFKSYHSACHSLAFALYKSTSRTTPHAPKGLSMLHKTSGLQDSDCRTAWLRAKPLAPRQKTTDTKF
jgi:hypothetical protein